MRVVTFKIEDELLERLDEYAELMGESRSEVIRRALELLLFRAEGKMRSLGKREIKVYTH